MGARRLSRMAADGAVEVLVSHCAGKQLNGLNEVVRGPNGGFYFTDE
jgi:sugar lactone lactonase YvrE